PERRQRLLRSGPLLHQAGDDLRLRKGAALRRNERGEPGRVLVTAGAVPEQRQPGMDPGEPFGWHAGEALAVDAREHAGSDGLVAQIFGRSGSAGGGVDEAWVGAALVEDRGVVEERVEPEPQRV